MTPSSPIFLGAGSFHLPECVDPEGTSHCWSHGDEAIPQDVYRVCFECGHVWTKRTLVRAYRTEIMQLADHFGERLRHRWRWLTITANRISFCQECIHDW